MDSKSKRSTISTAVVNKKPIPKKLSDSNNNKKRIIQSPETSDNSESDDDDADEDSYDTEEEELLNSLEYKKLLAKIFPSSYSKQMVKQGENLKNTILSKSSKVNKKQKENEEEEGIIKKPEPKQFNINLTFGNSSLYIVEDENEDEWTNDDSQEDGSSTEDEDEEDEDEDDEDSDDSDSDSDYDGEEEEAEEDDEEEEEEEKNPKKNTVVAKKPSPLSLVDLNKKKESDEMLLNQLKVLYETNNDNKTIGKCLEICKRDLEEDRKRSEKKTRKQRAKHSRIFKKIIRDKNTMNDLVFFNKMEVVQQKTIIKELREINNDIRVEKPYRMTLLESSMPRLFKSAAIKKISMLKHMEPGSGEYYKIKNWVDTFMRIPFGKYLTLPIRYEDGIDKCHDFMANAQKTLNDAVYGLNDAKMQIMQMLGQLITNPNAIGTAIAIKGPMGTGKTTLVREGISKILNRPFAFIALGGATDSSFLEGHSYTYEGSTWGKIVQILIDSKCMNPVIFFDELDKISDTPKGEEIAGILTHLTDTSQNTQFHDKYFVEVDFDLSKCLFIFSYNDESKINPILRDRMYRILTKGYNQKQKAIISNSYLLPKIREQVKFESDDIRIPDETIHYIIENLCGKEDGVRNLKRCLEIIYTKLNLYRLMKPGSNLFEEDMSLKVEFPFTVTRQIVDKLIKQDKDSLSASLHLYV
jgi:ATP-dependent Lon protease